MQDCVLSELRVSAAQLSPRFRILNSSFIESREVSTMGSRVGRVGCGVVIRRTVYLVMKPVDDRCKVENGKNFAK